MDFSAVLFAICIGKKVGCKRFTAAIYVIHGNSAFVSQNCAALLFNWDFHWIFGLKTNRSVQEFGVGFKHKHRTFLCTAERMMVPRDSNIDKHKN